MDGPSNELRRTEAFGNERPREMVVTHSWEQNPAYRRTPRLDKPRAGCNLAGAAGVVAKEIYR
jgi:hypothetical protein